MWGISFLVKHRYLTEQVTVRLSRDRPKNIVSYLHDCCGGAVDSIILVFTQMHRPSYNLKFETMRESI